MKIEENKTKITLKSIICSAIVIVVLIYVVMFYNIYFSSNKTYAKEVDISPVEDNEIEISTASEIDVNKIIDKNVDNDKVEKITVEDEVLEYLTKYRTNNSIPKGISYVVQEGMEGIQRITTKTIYDKNDNIISKEQIGTSVIKASSNKIVEIGGANYTTNYRAKVGDSMYVTSDVLGLWSEPTEESRKITTLKQYDEVKILEIKQSWYKVSYKNMNGWIKSECTLYMNLNPKETDTSAKTKQQLLSELNFNMTLNKPSGLTLNQFKKVLADDKDINGIFAQNAEYFYYIERQYNINGIFVAAVGIHESAWGTSKIALNKNNLFGYGAYDSNPYNGAYNFSNYAESIDLIARVLVKYYLNPAGTSIYGGEISKGTYYNGATLTGVNVKYATDKNWANSVYSYMKYLYNKL